MHPICTCSCLFTPLTEGRSARDLTQAAPSQKKKVMPITQEVTKKLWITGFLLGFFFFLLHSRASDQALSVSAASKHLERLLEGYCMEVFVTNTNPDSQLHFVRKFAKDLVVVFAFHLAETIATLFRHVLNHPSKVLYDPETEPLFLPLFWFYPIYREMLNSASRHRPSKSMELRRASRSKLRGEFGIPKHLQNRKQKHDKATKTPNPNHNTKQKGHGKCLEGETRVRRG